MKSLARRIVSHPKPEVLALYARGDLSLPLRLRVRAHVRRCLACERQAFSINSAVAELQRGDDQQCHERQRRSHAGLASPMRLALETSWKQRQTESPSGRKE